MPRHLALLTDLQTLLLFKVTKRYGSTSQKNHGLSELSGLNNLRGDLTIKTLEHMENAMTPTLGAILEEKKYIRSLRLEWESYDNVGGEEGREVRMDDKLLESLTPHPNLKSVTIKYFGGLELSRWLSSITNLTSITLSDCWRCQYIPPLDQLCYLESLSLRSFLALEYISEKGSSNSFSTPSTGCFQCLKEFRLFNCPELKGWWRRDDGRTTHMTKLPSFSCLSKLEIEDCPKLISMPLYPSLEELRLTNASSKPLEQTMMMKTHVAPSTSSSLSAPLSELKSLDLDSIKDLECLPEEGMQNLTSLVDMSIGRCSRLSQLSRGTGYLTSLQKMDIWSCNNLTNNDDDMQWQGLRSLRSLEFMDLPQNWCLSQWAFNIFPL
ncbi:hypothetical protein Pint_05214 [Pistacia integerrima]|uniref:Uncharacterized protein n=1 Tax=Pistacia integerrima TaxID=434235 RepID=A0ACC0Z4Z0_9ROSI|nr:hypothetical protein Pint_05214 [Pistacia integerrima]